MRLRGPNLDKIKIVIFDLDGVVVHPAWAFAKYLDCEHKITREHTREFFAGPFNDCLKGNAELKELLPPYLASWKWHGTVDDFVDLWLKTEDCPDARLLELIRELRASGMKCGLGTNQERCRAQFIRKNMRFESLFDHLFISCELGSLKPEEEFFKKVSKELDCPPDSILFFDNEQHYVDAAQRAGWKSELYVDYESLFAPRALYRFDR